MALAACLSASLQGGGAGNRALAEPSKQVRFGHCACDIQLVTAPHGGTRVHT